MNGLETLQKHGIQEISRRTYIPPEDLKAIFARDYAVFNRAKAIGFIHILEREYDVDLTEWLDEYKAANPDGEEEEEQIFLVAEAKDEMEMNKKVVLFALIAVALAAVFFLFVSGGSREETVSVQTPAVVQEARQEMETPEPEAVEETPAEESGAVEEAAAEEENLSQPQPEPELPETFYVESAIPLWMGITYEDGRTLSVTVEGRYELDPSRNQEIKFGHGVFKLVFGEEVYEPDSRRIQNFRLENGTLENLTRKAAPLPAARPKSPVIDPDDVDTQVPLEEIDQ